MIANAPAVDANTEVARETGARRAQGTIDVTAAVEGARRTVAPLWPLGNFVAVNPFMGLSDRSFAEAAQVMARRSGARLTAPRAFYAEALRTGRITRADLAAALERHADLRNAPQSVAELETFARDDSPRRADDVLPTVADVAQRVTGRAWNRLATESISTWAAGYFDHGQAYWKSPWRHLPPYAAWRAEAALDRSPEVAGVAGFRQTVHDLPADPLDAISSMLGRLDVPPAGVEPYLHRLLLTINGWAGFARYRLWEAELRGKSDGAVDELLAIRLVWEIALLEGVGDGRLSAAWAAARQELTASDSGAAVASQLAGELLLQTAFEHAYRRELFASLSGGTNAAPERPRAQAAFCIDVRSEIYRRALESVDRSIETIGFAGFFGFPIEFVRLGDERGGAQCPALIPPQFVIEEEVAGLDESQIRAMSHRRNLRRRAAKAWRTFKFGAVSCFGFVGPVGLAYLKKLATDTLGRSRPVDHPATYGVDKEAADRLGPRLTAAEKDGRLTGIPAAQRVDVAEGVLRAMSLTDNFARLVLLVGHGSTTVNNPYATGLDCGACGGHTGEANARVAAAVLNDPDVRSGLAARGIHIPDDTHVVPCLHNTTTDEVAILDRVRIPTSHQAEIAQIARDFAVAARTARAERARKLNVDRPAADGVDNAVLARSRDWSQVRPEWGLAGCAAFVVAPRSRTLGIDLDGRSFLHSYDWTQDGDFSVLELIMTAPMVVASWINLQYFGSTVDNERFGSGNKVLHNVVGTLGVLEGNGGDLRTGLPWQSVHDGEEYVHEPIRLHVMIEAPIPAMTDVIEKHENVRELLDNQWLFLFALDDAGRVSYRYAGDLTWEPI